MNLCGINQETQTAIMDPTFKSIRLTQSCLFWIRDTIEMRYRGLLEIEKASLEREMAIKRAASRPGELVPRQHAEAQPSARGSSSSALTGQRSISQTMRMAPGTAQETAMSETALLAAGNAPGSTTLFKCLDQGRLHRMFDNNGNVVDITRLQSSCPTDFYGKYAGYYFAVDRDIAQQYAGYAKHRSQQSSVVIIHITIENSAIESLPEDQLQRTYWPSEEWKALVFHSRKATKPNWVYVDMDSPSEIREEMVLKAKGGRNAVQYVFSGEHGEEFLKQHALHNLKVFTLTTREYNSWLA
ncbi:hypothetical protein V8C37DRAFT_379158 [Trichoderma ceciliae]